MLAPANGVGLVLQLGYFQISQRFYVATRYHAADVACVAQQLELGAGTFEAARYANARYYAYQQLLREQPGIARFDAAATDRLYQETLRLSSQHLKLAAVFDLLGAVPARAPVGSAHLLHLGRHHHAGAARVRETAAAPFAAAPAARRSGTGATRSSTPPPVPSSWSPKPASAH